MHHLTSRLCAAFSTMSSKSGPTMAASQKPILRGVIFDMDRTLTVPNLDFAEMYRRCDVSRDDDILSAVSKMEPQRADSCRSIIEEMEEESRLRLMPGTLELSKWMNSHGIPMALVTRNTAKTVDTLVSKICEENDCPPPFRPAFSRDQCGGVPPKPHPASLQKIATEWNVPLPSPGLIMVGDSPSNDVLFGKEAGVSTALLDTGRRYREENAPSKDGVSDDETPDVVIDNLHSLARKLWLNFEIEGSLGTGMPLLKFPKPVPVSTAAKAAVNGDVTLLESLSRELLMESDECGNTPLVWAADAGHISCVEAILRRLGDSPGDDRFIILNARGYIGATAISRAARRGHADVLRLLLSTDAGGGGDANIPNDKMQYPLHFAAFKEKREALDVLLEYGANTMVLDRKGRTPAEDTSCEVIRDSILRARTVFLEKHDLVV